MNTDNQGVYNARELGKPKFVLAQWKSTGDVFFVS